MISLRIIPHRLREPPLLLQPVVALLFQFADAVGGEEFADNAAFRELECHGLGAVLAELERACVLRVGPRATGTVEAVRLVHRQQRLRTLQRDALLAQRLCRCPQGTPATCGSVIGRELGRVVRRVLRSTDRPGWGKWGIAHVCSSRCVAEFLATAFTIKENT